VPGFIERASDAELTRRDFKRDPLPAPPTPAERATSQLESALALMGDDELTLARLRLENPNASERELTELLRSEPRFPEDWDPRFFRRLTPEEQRQRFGLE